MAGPGPTFPLHRLVWANRHRELEAALHSRQVRPAGHPGLRTQSRGLHPGGLPSPLGAAAASLPTFSGDGSAGDLPLSLSLGARLPALSLAHRPASLHAAPSPSALHGHR